jgi:DNA helicase-2/ATP-dependent DNA helicase PcrA
VDLRQMLSILQQQSGRQLNADQETVIAHGSGPLWVIAGPGSGKTEVLVLRCLKLACVDRVPPKSILLTTFTEKAARNIQDRLAIYKNYLDQADPSLKNVDVFQVRVGTLHGLCNDIMQEYRYAGYQNYRLLDDIDQYLFVYEHSSLAASSPPVNTHLDLWRQFDYLVSRFSRVVGYKWSRTKTYLPHRWLRANATVQLFNRIVEDVVDVGTMRAAGGVWCTLADAYEDYRQCLEDNLCCDFAHLQRKFLQFLATPNGNRFLVGDGSDEHPGLRHILVDEYQDTNPIQEDIYLTLGQVAPHNVCVVGDDDQALYRFRGGTVDCMVNFDQACARAWGQGVQVTKQPLSTNYRSQPQIVQWYDEFIRSFGVMMMPGARVANKPSLAPDPAWAANRVASGVTLGNYPSVSFLVGQDKPTIANDFAELVSGLLASGVVEDPSQCVLLLKSSQEWSAGPYQRALEQRGIPVYNPRARTFLQQEEVQAALGALFAVLDWNQAAFASVQAKGIRSTIGEWRNTYSAVAQANPGLAQYVTDAAAWISQTPAGQTVWQRASQGATNVQATIQELYYHIISFEPFATWQQDPVRTVRLGQLSQVLESYCSLPFSGQVGSNRGTLRTDPAQAGQLNSGQLAHLYNALVGLLVSEGLNDPEDEEVICPRGMFPIMTIHQAKGLEFPFVFVGELGIQNVRVGGEIYLEEAVRPFRVTAPAAVFTGTQRAEQDYIRLFYVAYSRAEFGLVLLSTASELRDQGLGFGGYGRAWFEAQAQRI